MPRTLHWLSLIGMLALVGAGMPASALSFTFIQTGYSEGAQVTGSFEGVDSDENGQLSSFEGEVTAFSVSFSGNSLVPAFSLGIEDEPFNFVYDIGSGFLGDGTTLDIEGVLSTNELFQYLTGQGPTGLDGGSVSNIISIDFSEQLVVVTQVPEPMTGVLLALGLAGIAAGRRQAAAWGGCRGGASACRRSTAKSGSYRSR